MSNTNKTTENSQIAEQVLVLLNDLQTLEAQKKAANDGFKEEIKRIKAEIKDLLKQNQEDEEAKAAAKTE